MTTPASPPDRFKQTEIGLIPEDWEVVKLGDESVSRLIMGQSPTSDTYNITGDGLPFFHGKADFGGKYPTAAKWCSTPIKIAEANDVLMSVRAPVGDVNLA
ncbi:MAG: restriction endonuclease subunit S, partial [Chloroflexi bacterium]|nr:restriction endonuclease subunit S [Chloroflexota bacterium]